MTLRSYLLGMFISTIICWLAFGIILYYINPYTTGPTGQVAFFVSLFFASIGTLTLIGYYLRIWFTKKEMLFGHINPSFRQAILLSVILVGSLILQALRLLNWWDGALFVISVVLIEFYFLSR